MISFFRRLFDSWLGRIIAIGFVVLVGLAFALADVSGTLGGGGGGGGATVAEVGKLDISASEFSLALQTEQRRMREQNPNIDMATMLNRGAADSVMDRLLAAYAVAAFAGKVGMGASDAMVESEIAKLPGVNGLDGKFDPAAYNNFLSSNNITDKQLRDDIRRSFMAEQLLAVASLSASPPKANVDRYASINFESRTGKVAVLPSVLFAPEGEPTDSQLQSFYSENSDRFTIPERRSMAYAFFTPDIVGDRANPTDEEIAAYYNENRDEFQASKSVRYRQLVVPSQAVAQQVARRVRAGETLDAVARELGFEASGKRADSQAELADEENAAVAGAIYAADEGEVTAPVEGEFGFVVAKITDVTTQPARSLSQASADIRSLLASDKGLDAFRDVADDMQDRLEDGESLSEIAKSYDLKVQSTPLVLPDGKSPDNPNYKPSMPVQNLLPKLFDMDADSAGQLTEAGQNRFAIIAVADRAEAAPPPLKEVRPIIVEAWKLAQGQDRARKAGEKAMKAVKSGTALNKAIADLDTRLPRPQVISGSRQEIAEQGREVPQAMLALFQIPNGGSRLVPVGQDRGFLLIQVDEIRPAKLAEDDERLPQFTSEYSAALEQELQRQFVAAMQKEVGVDINESARDAVIERLRGDS